LSALRPFQHIVMSYWDSNLQRNQMKDAGSLSDFFKISQWSEVSWPSTLTTEEAI